jgi:hypothetical protein
MSTTKLAKRMHDLGNHDTSYNQKCADCKTRSNQALNEIFVLSRGTHEQAQTRIEQIQLYISELPWID